MPGKTVYTLNIGDYAPEIRALTYPLMRYYARKIGAEFVEIRERRYPEWPIVCEKLQIYDLARESGAEWNLFFDADALIHPEMIDWTAHIPKDTVAQNGHDFSSVRHRLTPYHLRDGRHISTCGWCTIASDWCLDLWHPPEDLTPDEVEDACFLTTREMGCGMLAEHLADDFIMSRNVARYGLKYTTLDEIIRKLFPPLEVEKEQLGEYQGKKTVLRRKVQEPIVHFFAHVYTVSEAEKVETLHKALDDWHVPDSMLDGADLSWRKKDSAPAVGFDRVKQARMVEVVR